MHSIVKSVGFMLLLSRCLMNPVTSNDSCPAECSCSNCTSVGSSDEKAMRCTLVGVKNIREMPRSTKMCILDLSSNGIMNFQQIAFGNFSSLLNLSLSNNLIEEIPRKTFSNFTNLETLNLDQNKIYAIQQDGFEGLTKLKRLFLDHNELVSLASGTFKGLISLTHLGLGHNKLRSWEGTFYKELPNLIHLHIEGNAEFRFKVMPLTSSVVALEKIYGITVADKCNKACAELTRVNVSRKTVLPKRLCQYTPNQYLPMLDKYQERSVLLKGQCGAKQCELLLTDIDPLYKIFKDKCWTAVRDIRAIEYCLGLAAVIINIVVIVVTVSSKVLRRKTSFLLIAHLAFCDLMMGSFIIMIATGHGIDHDPSFRYWRKNTCPYYRTVFLFSQTMGLATSLLVTLERYLVIVYGMRPSLRVTPTIACLSLGFSWVLSGIMATLIEVIDHVKVRDNFMCVLVQNFETVGFVYSQGLMVVLALLYFSVIGLYTHLYSVVRKSAQNAGVQHESKLAKRIGLIVFSNLLFFVVPNLFLVVFTASTLNVSSKPILNALVRTWLPPLCMAINACLNPMLFAFRNDRFISALKLLTRCRNAQVAHAPIAGVKPIHNSNNNACSTMDPIDPRTKSTNATPPVSMEMENKEI